MGEGQNQRIRRAYRVRHSMFLTNDRLKKPQAHHTCPFMANRVRENPTVMIRCQRRPSPLIVSPPPSLAAPIQPSDHQLCISM